MQPIVVLDTNVIVSAMGWEGTPRRCLDMARRGDIEGITCIEIMEELAAVLHRKLGFSDQQVIETHYYLMSFLRLTSPTGQVVGVCADPMDDKVLDCALTSGAHYVVTGDKRHLLAMRKHRGVPIVAPAELIRLVTAKTM